MITATDGSDGGSRFEIRGAEPADVEADADGESSEADSEPSVDR